MNIPTYVFILFAVLVYMGIKRCFTRVIKVQRLFISPIFFSFFSIRGISELFDLTIFSLSLLFAGCLIGLFLGFKQVGNRNIRVDRKQKLIEVPGDLSMLFLIFSAFSSEFFIHYLVESESMLATTSTFKIISLIISGLFTGLSAGRAFNYFWRYRTSPDMPLAR
ncbi:DUF6622 family protein [Legionella dresdenensis]|uniref:DUF6622 family protein n=1 Tax=Legionella dresdenensis TaxID=450200 RepID=A0ABV8CG19_9GAMM